MTVVSAGELHNEIMNEDDMRIFSSDTRYVIRTPDGEFNQWQCIHANEQFAWLTQGYNRGSAAYCWAQDGKPICLPGYEVANLHMVQHDI